VYSNKGVGKLYTGTGVVQVYMSSIGLEGSRCSTGLQE
jgi:hypothetical protein